MNDYIEHHGIKGQRWGVRRSPEQLGHFKKRVFVSGSSKTQDKTSGYYRKKLPKQIRAELDRHMKKNHNIIVGDAPGIDRQVQNYLKKHNYQNVDVYGPGKKVRYSADKSWRVHPIDDPDHEIGSKEWLEKKDRAMQTAATEGLAVVLDNGANATRNNIQRLISDNKDVKVFQLNTDLPDDWNLDLTFRKK